MINEYGQDIDRMWEADAAAAWEELNDVPEEPEKESEEEPVTKTELFPIADRAMRLAIESLDSACDEVNEAAETLVDTPDGDRLQSVLFEMEKLLKELKDLQEKIGKEAA